MHSAADGPRDVDRVGVATRRGSWAGFGEDARPRAACAFRLASATISCTF